jgi:hypothetical protein
MYMDRRVLVGVGAMLFLFAFFSGGCATQSGISMHRLRDLEAGDYYAEFEQFQKKEIPCVLVEGFGGRTVCVDLYDRGSGLRIRREEAYIKDGTSKWFYWPSLQAGEYRSVLTIDDELVDEAVFVFGREE